MKEVETLMKLDHPGILKLHDFFSDEHKFYIVTSIHEGGELFERIIQRDNFSEEKV